MGAKIYDSTSASWKDAETPKIYVGSAFADSKGMSYNGSEWVEDWGSNTIEFKSENDFNQFQIVSPGVGTRSWNSSYGFTSTITTPTTTNVWRYLDYKYTLRQAIDIVQGLEISYDITVLSGSTNRYMGGFEIVLYSGSTVQMNVRFSDDWDGSNNGSISGKLKGWIFSFDTSLGTHHFDIKVGQSYSTLYVDNASKGGGGTVDGSFDNVVIHIFEYPNEPLSPSYINNIYIGPERS